MQPKIKAKETIKPFHPTPENKRALDLSLLDHFSPHIFNRFFFFYHQPNTHQNPITISQKTIEQLKTSLSNTLSSYYPFAGRVNKGGHIDCNDEGIELIETHSTCRIADILKQPQYDAISKLFPISGEESIKSSNIDSLVLIQITTFNCGGIAIGACFSHKIADAGSVATFMNDWASVMRNPSHDPIPQFDGASFFPTYYDKVTTFSKSLCVSEKCLTRRFLFDISKIDAVRKNDGTSTLKELNPTRFEIVSAVICKSLLSASKALELKKPSILNIIVNLRTKMQPQLSENHIGNFALHNLVKVKSDETSLYNLVALLKDGMAKFRDMFGNKLHSLYERSLEVLRSYQELEGLVVDGATEMLMFSSCRFPFYDVDFGFGKPIWASILPNPTKNCVFLCDTKDGNGLEAWVTLEDRVMTVLEHDNELLGFASLNPSPLVTDWQLT